MPYPTAPDLTLPNRTLPDPTLPHLAIHCRAKANNKIGI